MLERFWATISERFWQLTLTEVGLLLILGAICIYGGRMLSQLRRVNHYLRALGSDEDRLQARIERELLALDLDRRAANLLPKMPQDGVSPTAQTRPHTGTPR